PYWQSVVPLPGADFFEADPAEEPGDDLHLRSADEVTGYHIHAADGDVGHLEDLIADDEAWLVRYLVVDTGDWLPGRKVLLAPALVQSIDWVNRMIYVDVERDSVKQCPEYDPEAPVDREYEVQLYEHYGRPHYWL
ncbi:MAG TPA: PRC-barrel domain-containing protein, partial [Anaerolineae bacterium]|nr:PRC-barrel domain-containing protein [Anaerolineae bacterium]